MVDQMDLILHIVIVLNVPQDLATLSRHDGSGEVILSYSTVEGTLKLSMSFRTLHLVS